MAEFEIEGDQYQSRKLAPKLQLRVLKRLARIAPALKGAGAVVDKLKDGARPSLDEMADALAPIITAFADMPDEDVEFVIDTALDHTMQKPKDSQRWYKVRENGVVPNKDNEQLVRSMVITWYVVRDNFETIFRSMTTATASSL